MGMKTKAVRGVLWSLVEFGGGEGIAFVVFLVLARLVAPSDFGTVALAGAFVAFVQLFLVQGFADAVIQRQELDPDHVSTVFWTNLGIAAAFFAATMLGADLLAQVFGQPLLGLVLRGLSPLFLTSALISTHQAMFKRDLRFAAFAMRALVGVGLGGLVGIVMAFQGWGVWALVAQQLANGIASVIVIWATSEWRPQLRCSRRHLAELAPFAGNVIGSNLVTFFARKLDIFLIGLFLDAVQLGYYYLVLRLVTTLGLVTLSTVQAIVMPVLSRLQGDRYRFQQGYATAIQLSETLWLPTVLGLGLVAPTAVPLLFGDAWLPAVPLLQVVSLVGFTQVFSVFSAQVLYAAGRPAVNLRLSVLQVLLTASVFIPATRFGVIGVAAGFALVSALAAPLHQLVLHRTIGTDPIDLARRCLPPIAAGIVMAIAVGLVELRFGTSLRPVQLLAVELATGAATYAGILLLLAPALIRDVVGIAAAALGRRAPAPS